MFVELKYNNKKDSFEVESDIKPEKIKEVVTDYIRTNMGAGKDTSQPEMKEIYTIRIELDLTEDNFSVSSDTNNKSLTTGILMHWLRS